MTNRRVTFDYDPDPDLSWLEQWDTPSRYRGCEVIDKHGRKIPFDEYVKYYGDPSRHVTLCMVVEDQCEHCGSWKTIDALGGIDFMDDDNYHTGSFTKDTLHQLTNVYQLEIAQEALGGKVKA